MKTIMSLATGVRGYIAAVTALNVAGSATVVAQGFLMARVLAALLSGDGVSDSADLFGWIAALVVVRFLLVLAAARVADLTGAATKQALRRRAFGKLSELGPGHLSGRRTGELKSALVEDIESLERYYGSFLPSLSTAVLVSGGIVVVLGLRDIWLAAVLVGWMVVGVVGPMLWAKPLEARGTARMSAYVGLGATLLDVLQGITTLKAFGAGARRRKELAEKSDHLVAQWVREMAVALVSTGIATFAVVGGLACMVAVAAYRCASGATAVETVFLTLLLSAEALRTVGTLAGSFHTSYDAATGARRLTELFETPRLVGDTARDEAGPLEPSIAFEGVTFTYPGREDPVLTDFSLRVEVGETVAVVGPSGAGKSTLVALLARFFDPQHGSVRVGGRDLRDLPLTRLRSLISVVSQDTYLFTGTVRANIAMARPGAAAADVERAARIAGAHDFIADLPDGYDTEISERGTLLSGGQRQRLAIARAVLADRPILVLDEATASVDAATEAAIQAALDRLTVDRTTVVIAHRLSTVRDADRIVVLDQGRTAESGTHTDLLARVGRYRDLVAAQQEEH
ncbi:ABC transporter, permease/ATP-binding protein [Nocardia nova SH22a]|uniref:ABC transporter, permease/ATP-binding protein n=1 Tax=Nocardia nova SH22a TaxID=1415166 RepID=W5TML2_9NOCA|nr:ABC transporter ATP-binding protein [Nocardia nova]AHH20233.1 ABC transporter, permease/ATP-binding protein [Nocardia nova SH22a]